MLFSQLASYFEKIEATRSRLTMTHLLAELFAELDQNEIRKVTYLLQGQILPLYQKIDFGIGEKMVARAAAKALGIDKAMFEKEYSQTGDIGLVVEKFKRQVTTIFAKDDMKVLDVYDKLKELAIVAGAGSQEGKMGLLIDLIQTLDPLSARYVVRIPTQTLRLGFSDMTIFLRMLLVIVYCGLNIIFDVTRHTAARGWQTFQVYGSCHLVSDQVETWAQIHTQHRPPATT